MGGNGGGRQVDLRDEGLGGMCRRGWKEGDMRTKSKMVGREIKELMEGTEDEGW